VELQRRGSRSETVERKMKGRGDESGENDQSFERSRTVRLTTANNTSRVCVRVYVCVGRKHRHGTYYYVPDCSRQIRDVLFRFSGHGSGRGAGREPCLVNGRRACCSKNVSHLRYAFATVQNSRSGDASDSHCRTLA